MNILFDNVNFESQSGPNSFAGKLMYGLHHHGHKVNDTVMRRQDSNAYWKPDIQLSFITATQLNAPTVQRLDGIYFNSEQDFVALNAPIRATYELAKGVVYQSAFNKALTEKYFGMKKQSTIIHNGTSLDAVSKIPALKDSQLDKHDKIYVCASSWRPHKRLGENVRYFLEHATEKDCLVVAGQNPDANLDYDNVYYVGNLSWELLISLYKRANIFLHLALMDHCPNVVIDARASACEIVCSDSGGTSEIAGADATIVEDMQWDFEPFKLYEPPMLDFSKKQRGGQNSDIEIRSVASRYINFFDEILAEA